MKTIRIISLHLAYGGVEKAIIGMANLFVEKYNVEILSVYNMPGSPAFPLDERVKVRYLLSDTPNREQWKNAVRNFNIPAIFRESIRSVRVLVGKKLAVRKAVKNIHDGVLMTTRHEDNLVLSAYGDKNVLKIAQMHHDHNFQRKYVQAFKHRYKNIDILALLTPRHCAEVKEMMDGHNEHTKIVNIPNFLESYPQNVDMAVKEKLVVAVGRLDPVKGFDRLVRIFASVHKKAEEWSLHIIGEGSEREKIEKLIDEYDAADYIKLVGKLDADEVENEMRRASVYAMSSKSECLPFVIIEAQSCYLPTVAFAVRVGPGTLIDSGVTGFLVPDGDEDAFVEKMLELMNSQELRASMGEAARRHSLQYSRENIAAKWQKVLDENDG